jgi:predicted nucleic acid-binding protein
MITSEKFAVDTNILIYLHDDNEVHKKQVTIEIMRKKPVIPSQVISEYLNVLKRLTREPKLRLIEHCLITMEDCHIVSTNIELVKKAKDLIIRYDFQLYDSLIVAAALISGSNCLYSEDLQHNFLVENRLRIINPFL